MEIKPIDCTLSKEMQEYIKFLKDYKEWMEKYMVAIVMVPKERISHTIWK